MLVVVGTPALRDYIGQLLAALDLGGVSVVTFDSWARKARRRCFPWLDPPIEESTPAEVSRLKTAPEIQKLLEKRARELRMRGRGKPQDALALWAEVLTNRRDLEEALADSDRLSPQGLERAWRYCSDRCPAVVEWTKDEGYEDSEGSDIRGADGVLEQSDERATIDLEDEALLLRVYQIVCGPIPSRRRKAMRYEHLFVDEAQDLAPIDIAVLSGIVTGGNSITLAGDTAQRLHIDTGFRNWSEVLDGLDLEHVTVEPLRIAYRSTREVLPVARAVLGPLADDEPPVAHRSGSPVEHHHFQNAGAAAAFLGEALRPLFVREPNATVAVLARYAEQADLMYKALQMAEVPHLTRVEDFQFTFRPGVEVTEIAQVKGLEYDYVVLIDVNATSYPDKDEARYQLHIGCTRAAHQLWIISSGKPSPLLPPELIG
jgi:DNA helicase-2/ATP-dependent DNA helicase PcrA